MRTLPNICNWQYLDLLDLPHSESDIYEYKSSRTPTDQLKNKISIASSAFWNSGGGVFIAGVNNQGVIDGGIPFRVGNQSIRDWVDQAVMLTEPHATYEVMTIPISEGSNIDGNVVIIIKFDESHHVPHMAFDRKYYIRVGTHSNAANHFLVEALRSLRNYTKPILRGLLEYNPLKPKGIDLVITSINEAAALNVIIDFDPLPKAFAEHLNDVMPLEIALINKENPFRMQISYLGIRDETFGDGSVKLILKYNDVLGKNYYDEQGINPHKNIQPLIIGETPIEKIAKSIETIAKKS